MEIINNIAKATGNNKLKTPIGIRDSIKLGYDFGYPNGIKVEYNITTDDIIEVYPVNIDNTVYYVESKNYSDLVTELIRIKYSLNDELALQANYRLNGDSEEEKQFQDWRTKCKNIAKQIIND